MSRYQLVQTATRLELRDTLNPKAGAVCADFLSGPVQHRRRYGGGKGQDIARAVGLHKQAALHVLDCTAGLGREAFVLASLGCYVTLLERNPIVHALLADGLQRAQADPEVAAIVARMELHHVDAKQWLAGLSCDAQPDVVCLDPMFPQRHKSALVQKEMQFFHAVVGEDADSAELLGLARKAAKQRVVVKRPLRAPVLAGTAPAFAVTGKTVRYDVYLPSGHAMRP